jgi:excisionase family DNA binding protein
MKRDRPNTLLPRGLSRTEAAEYIGISPSKFDELVKAGTMPVPKEIGARRVWDRHAIDAAFDDLPSADETNPFDGVDA